MSEFESTPYDGKHQLHDPGNDWRGGTGIVDSVMRATSYGNYAGPGNRILAENKDYVEEQRKLNPHYNENYDPKFSNDPRYAPVDGLDALAKVHDTGYPDHLKGNMFSWEGMNSVKEDDRALAEGGRKEMAEHGDKYSPSAKRFADGMEGFFGGRVMALDAVDWVGNKAHEAGQGISNFAEGATKWGSVDEAVHGVGSGVSSAAHWLGAAGSEAAVGIETSVNQTMALGGAGMATTAMGLANVAGAGVGHLAGEAWDGAKAGAKSIGSGFAGGAEELFHHYAV